MSDWDNAPSPDPQKESKAPDYRPSSEVIPHWAEEKPTWIMTDEEFWRSQVAGRLLAMQERRFPSKGRTRFAEPLGQQIMAWINGTGELTSFTPAQTKAAEEEARSLRRLPARKLPLPSGMNSFRPVALLDPFPDSPLNDNRSRC